MVIDRPAAPAEGAKIAIGKSRTRMSATVILLAQEGIDEEKLARQVRQALPAAGVVFVAGALGSGGKASNESGYRVIQVPNGDRLSRGIVEGIRSSHDSDIIVVVDGGASDPAQTLQTIISGLEHSDLVVGSRWAGDKGSSSRRRRTSAISKLANIVSIPLAPRVKDRTSGIFGFRKAVVNPADLDPKAWNMGLEIMTRGHYAAVAEVPYSVVPDGRAQTGPSWKELVGYTRQLISLYMSKFQILNFMVVGGIGYFINMGAYWLLLRVFKGTEATFLGQHFYLPPFVLSSLLAIVSNYELNKVWTFRGWSEHSVGFLRYLSMALLTLLLDMAALWALVDWGKLTPILAAAVAIAIVFVIRYLIAKRWIWSRKPPSPS